MCGVLAAALLLGLASAGRLSEQVDSLGLRTSDAVDASLAHMHMRSHVTRHSNEETMAIISSRYIVPPSVHDEFIDKWQSVFDKTGDEQQCIMYDMAKTKIDNVVFSTYGEWQNWDAFNQHLDSDYVKDWVSFLSENEIKLTWYSLSIPGNDIRPAPSSPSASSINAGPEKGSGYYTIVRYMVPHDKHSDFISTWQQTADEMRDKEQGKVMFYSLRKVETDNFSFYIYGSWDSYDSWVEHFKSDYMKALLKFSRDNDIAWFMSPLRKWGRKDQ